MTLLKISVQIPTFNQQNVILRAIKSVLMQDYNNLEIIISDDCSDDNTEEIIKKINDPRVKYYKNKTNLGRVGNYKNSLNNYCTGDWVVNLDGDDYFTEPTFISSAVQAIMSNSNAVLYMAQNSEVDKISKFTHTSKNLGYLMIDGLKFLESYSFYPCFFHLSALYNRELALKNAFYNVNCLIADFVSIMKLADEGDFIITDKIVGKWDISATSASQTLNVENNKKNVLGINGLIKNLKCKSLAQREKIRNELLYVNQYHLVTATASKKEFTKSLIGLMKLASFRKNYFWKGLLRFLIKG